MKQNGTGINKFRISGLNIDHTRNLLEDTVWSTNLEKTGTGHMLLNLKNGGGKSTILLALQQVINPGFNLPASSQRKTSSNGPQDLLKRRKDGTNERFFVQAEFLVDSKIDLQEDRLLVGIAMRRKQGAAGDENSVNAVEWYTWIYPHKKGDMFDIDHIPIYDAATGHLGPWEVVRELEGKPKSFLTFSRSRKAEYQQALRAYGIEPELYSNLFKSVGRIENGLGAFHSENLPNEEKMIRYCLGIIDEKDGQVGENLAVQLRDCAANAQTKSENLAQRERIAAALPLAESLSKTAEAALERYSAYEGAISQIKAFSDACAEASGSGKIERDSIVADKQDAQQDLDQAEFLMLSTEYKETSEEHDRAKSSFEEALSDLDATKRDIEKASIRKDAITYASYQTRIDKESGTLAALRAKRDEMMKPGSAAYMCERYRQSCAHAIDAELAALKARQDLAAADLGEAHKAMRAAEDKKFQAEKEEKDADVAQKVSNNAVNQKSDAAERALADADIHAERLIDGSIDSVPVHQGITDSERALKQAEKEKTDAEKALTEADMATSEAQEAYSSAREETAEQKWAEANATRNLEEYDIAKSELESSLQDRGFSLKNSTPAAVKRDLKQRLEDCRLTVRRNNEKVSACKDKLGKLEAGTLHIARACTDHLDSIGVDYDTGESRLRTFPEEFRDRVLEAHPEFAYSIVLDKTNRAKLDRATRPDYLPNAVPVYTQDDIMRLQDGRYDQDVHTQWYAAPIVDAIKDEASYRADLQSEIEAAESEMTRATDAADDLGALTDALETFILKYDDADGTARSALAESQRAAQAALAALERDQKAAKRAVDDAREALSQAKRGLDAKRQAKQEAYRRLEAARIAATIVEELSDAIVERRQMIARYEAAKRNLNAAKDALETAKTRLKGAKDACDKVDASKRTLEAMKHELGEAGDMAAEPTSILEDASIDSLYSTYKQLVEKSSDELNQIDEKIEESARHIADLQKTRDDILGAGEDDDREKQVIDLAKQTEIIQASSDGVALRTAEETLKKLRGIESNQNYAVMDQQIKMDKLDKKLEAQKAEIQRRFKRDPGAYHAEGLNAARREVEELKRKVESLEDSLKAMCDRIEVLDRSGKTARKFLDDLPSAPHVSKVSPCTLEDDIDAQYEALHDNVTDLRNKVNTVKGELKDIAQSFDSTAYAQDDLRRINARANYQLYNVCVEMETHQDAIQLKTRVTNMALAMAKRHRQVNDDLKSYDKSRQALLDHVLHRIRDIYDSLRQIERASKLTLDEKQWKTLDFGLPSEEYLKDQRLVDAADSYLTGRIGILAKLIKEKGGDIESAEVMKKARAAVKSEALNDVMAKTVARGGRLHARKLRITSDGKPDRLEKWDAYGSGAQCAIYALYILISTARYSATATLEINRNQKIVLMVDNPFGEISSGDLLNVFFMFLKQSNTQLIAASAHATQDIVRNMDARITLRVISAANNKGSVKIVDGSDATEPQKKLESATYRVAITQDALF